MFTLGKGILNEFFKKKECYVLLVGLDGAGKTLYAGTLKQNFDKNYVRPNPSKILNTVGLNVVKVDFDSILLFIWDVGGQIELRSLWKNYVEESAAIIFMIDLLDKKRLDEALQCMEDFMKIEHISNIPVLILLNKSELKDIIKTNKTQLEKTCLNETVLPQNNNKSSSNLHLLENNESDVFDIRLKVYEKLNTISRKCDDLAVISISALHNLNVNKSALWIINVLLNNQPH